MSVQHAQRYVIVCGYYLSHASIICTLCMHVKDSDDVAFISLDGNFRLCRRKNAGQQSILYEKPLSGDRVFMNQSDVDRYVHSSSSLLVTLEFQSQTRNAIKFS